LELIENCRNDFKINNSKIALYLTSPTDGLLIDYRREQYSNLHEYIEEMEEIYTQWVVAEADFQSAHARKLHFQETMEEIKGDVDDDN
jgi:hypothetical protein